MLVTSIVCRAHKAAGLALDRLYIQARVAFVFVLQADKRRVGAVEPQPGPMPPRGTMRHARHPGIRLCGGEDADLAVGGQAAGGGADIGAGGRRDVGVVAAGRDGDVAAVGPAIVARVERDGFGLLAVRNDHLDPGVGAALAEQVSRYIPGGQLD
jgi:hypothetical protein